MFPIILVAKNQNTHNVFIEDFKKKQGFTDLQLQHIVPEKTSLTINQIRELKKELSITSAKPRLIIFEQFDSATNEAQNALLKVLEEQNTRNQFIMLVTRVGTILPTIISRSRVIDLEEEKTIYDAETTAQIDTFLDNPTISYMSERIFTVKTKEEAFVLLKVCIDRLHNRLHSKPANSTVILKKSFDLLYKLEHNNLSPQLTIDHWIISVLKNPN